MSQEQNRQLVDWLSAFFQLRYESSLSWAEACSLFAYLTNLRAFWPMSSVDENGDVYDLSAQGRVLTNNVGVTFGLTRLASYAAFNGNTWLSRPDENGLDMPTTFTLGGWFYRSAAGAEHRIMGKSNIALVQSYHLLFRATNVARFVIDNGAGVAETIDTVGTAGASEWHFVAGRFTANTQKMVMLDSEIVTGATALAAVANTAQDFTIGETVDGANRLSGRASLCFLSTYAIPDAILLAIYGRTRSLFQSLT